MMAYEQDETDYTLPLLVRHIRHLSGPADPFVGIPNLRKANLPSGQNESGHNMILGALSWADKAAFRRFA